MNYQIKYLKYKKKYLDLKKKIDLMKGGTLNLKEIKIDTAFRSGVLKDFFKRKYN